jgi:hypothetical protein
MLDLPNLTSLYSIDRNFQKSRRLDADLNVSEISSYQLNSSVWHVIRGIAEQIINTKQRAFTITGPYGSGKSSLAIFLTAALSSKGPLRNKAEEILGTNRYSEFNSAFKCSENGWMTVKIVGNRTDILPSIMAGLKKETENFLGTKHRLTISLQNRDNTLAELIISLKEIEEELYKQGTGLLLLIDEMGKFLEFASLSGGDIYPLQEISEIFSRGKGNTVFIGILHQAFADYARSSGDTIQAEWAKIQGRFVDFPFSVGLDEVAHLISSAIKTNSEPTVQQKMLAETVANTVRSAQGETLSDALATCGPLHPVTTLLLGPISRRRFGQNERSVFSFLCSYEPNGFMDFLQSIPATDFEYYSPAKLWDYLQTNHEPSILASPDGKRWSEAAEAVLRATHRQKSTTIHVDVTKTIGLLDLFGRPFGLQATEDILTTVINLHPSTERRRGRPPKNKIVNQNGISLDIILSDLKEWSVAIPRRHAGAWGLFAGSDIDIEIELSKVIEKIRGDNNAILATLQDLPPVVAKRHFAKTGTLRLFERKIVRENDIEEYLKSFDEKSSLSGTFLLILPEEQLQDSQKRLFIPEIPEDKAAFVAIIDRSSAMLEAALEVAALERLPSIVPQLHGDAVARRELNARLLYTKADLSNKIRQQFNDAIWNSRQLPPARVSQEGLTVIASKICDIVFKDTPHVHNELINRNSPSPTAGMARKKLMLAMLENHEIDRLGISGEPAELGLYLSLLRKMKLHVKNDRNSYSFVAPEPDNSLYFAWQAATSLLIRFSKKGDPVLISDLYKLWKAPPFGMRDGVIPVFTYAFMHSMRGQLALYVDGNYVIAPDEFFIERLIEDPNSISMQLLPQNEAIDDFIERFNQLNSSLNFSKEKYQTLLEVTKPLVQTILKLHPWVKRTKRLTGEPSKIRDAALSASDPYNLVFHTLPYAIGLQTDEHINNLQKRDYFFNKLQLNIKELNLAYSKLLKRFGEQIVTELGVSAPWKDAVILVADRANSMPRANGDLRLTRFIDALKSAESDKGSWIEAICSLATSKPMRDWGDSDIDRCAYEISQIVNRYHVLETTNLINNDSDKTIGILVKKLRAKIDLSTLERRQKRAALMVLLSEINGEKNDNSRD